MSEVAYSPENSPNVFYDELLSQWYAQLTDVLLIKGVAEQDGTYYSMALDDDTYAMVTNYATASCHVNYGIDSNDRSQRASLDNRDPILTVEFRHVHTDQVTKGYVICRPDSVEPKSVLGASIRHNMPDLEQSDTLVVINTSGLTEVRPVEVLNSPLSQLVRAIM